MNVVKNECIKTTNLQVNLTELPSGTITSDEVSSAMKSGGMTTSKYPICEQYQTCSRKPKELNMLNI